MAGSVPATLVRRSFAFLGACRFNVKKQQGDLMKRLVLALALAALPAAALFAPLQGQTPAPTQPRPPGPAPDYNAGGLPRVPTYGSVEGQPIDARLPEKKVDTRQFPEQTRAPYHHPTDFKMTVLTNQLHAAWASALLPDGKLLVTE